MRVANQEKGGLLGKMRVDEVDKMFHGLMPERSKNFFELYKKAWNPTAFASKS